MLDAHHLNLCSTEPLDKAIVRGRALTGLMGRAMSKLPPLTAIRAFEAAARHESFTKAAAELGMTQAAISYQVKLLEDRVGAPLFLRQPKKVVLSEVGKRLAPQVSEAFHRLEAAFAAMRGTAEGVLSVTTVHTFATNWLVPRLGAFQLAHPDIAVRLDVSSRTLDLTREEFDIGIRGGQGAWPGHKAHRLMEGEFTPLCSPELLARSGPLKEPADLLRLPRLDAHDEWWRQWFALAGVDYVKPPRRRQPDGGCPIHGRHGGHRGPGGGDPDAGLLQGGSRRRAAGAALRHHGSRQPELLAGLCRGARQYPQDPRLPRLDPGGGEARRQRQERV